MLVLNALVCTLLGLAVGQVLQAALSAQRAARVGQTAEHLALRLLLPLVIFESLLHVPVGWGVAWPLLLGALLPMQVWALAAMQRPKAPWRAAAALACTFGGGNRGVALVSLALAASPALPQALRTFVLIDLGNLMCMLLVLPRLLSRQWPAPEQARFAPAWTSLLQSPALSVVAVCVASAGVFSVWGGFEQALANTSSARKAMLMVLVFVGVGVKMPLIWRATTQPKEADSAPSLWAHFFALRAVCALPFWVAWVLGSGSVQWSAAMALVMLALPPSSWVGTLLAKTGMNADLQARLAWAVVQANMGYLALLAMAAFLAVAQAS